MQRYPKGMKFMKIFRCIDFRGIHAILLAIILPIIAIVSLANKADALKGGTPDFGQPPEQPLIFDGVDSDYDGVNDFWYVIGADSTEPYNPCPMMPSIYVCWFGTGGKVARMYEGAMNRHPETEGFVNWSNALNTNVITLEQMAEAFLASPEFLDRFGVQSDDLFLEQLYWNVLKRISDPVGKSVWLQALKSGSLSRAQVLLYFVESQENIVKKFTDFWTWGEALSHGWDIDSYSTDPIGVVTTHTCEYYDREGIPCLVVPPSQKASFGLS